MTAENDPLSSQHIAAWVRHHRNLLDEALERFAGEAETLSAIAHLLVATIRRGGTILLAGNGGSAAEAQHFAAELVGRFQRERRPYAALALTTDSSILTAIANDYAYEEVFARQLEAVGRPGNVLIAISTSGRSPNLLRAAAVAHSRDIRVVALTGAAPNPLAEAADLTLRIPTVETPLVQELQMMTTHLLCELIEDELAGDE